MTESTDVSLSEEIQMSEATDVHPKPRRRKAISAETKKPGRPSTVGMRQHLFLSENVREALVYCSEAMDAVGPSEVIRVSLMHCRNAMIASENGVDIVSQEDNRGVSLCGLLDGGFTFEPVSGNPKMHITMTPATSGLLSEVSNTSGLLSPSAAVSLAILMFEAYMRAVKNGHCVVLSDAEGAIAGYSPWLSEEELRTLCQE